MPHPAATFYDAPMHVDSLLHRKAFALGDKGFVFAELQLKPFDDIVGYATLLQDLPCSDVVFGLFAGW